MELHPCMRIRDLLATDILDHVQSLDVLLLFSPVVGDLIFGTSPGYKLRYGSATEGCEE
jgi:hypothetical protein